jgi:hypothetical protein
MRLQCDQSQPEAKAEVGDAVFCAVPAIAFSIYQHSEQNCSHVFSVTKGSEAELLSGGASGNTPKA